MTGTGIIPPMEFSLQRGDTVRITIGDLTLENIKVVTMVAVIHFTFVLSAIGISFAERLTREKT